MRIRGEKTVVEKVFESVLQYNKTGVKPEDLVNKTGLTIKQILSPVYLMLRAGIFEKIPLPGSVKDKRITNYRIAVTNRYLTASSDLVLKDVRKFEASRKGTGRKREKKPPVKSLLQDIFAELSLSLLKGLTSQELSLKVNKDWSDIESIVLRLEKEGVIERCITTKDFRSTFFRIRKDLIGATPEFVQDLVNGKIRINKIIDKTDLEEKKEELPLLKETEDIKFIKVRLDKIEKLLDRLVQNNEAVRNELDLECKSSPKITVIYLPDKDLYNIYIEGKDLKNKPLL